MEFGGRKLDDPMARQGKFTAARQARDRKIQQQDRAGLGDSGFVLLFALWVLTAAAVLLAIYAKKSASAPPLLEAQLDYPVEVRQALSVADFVLDHMSGRSAEVDSRWVNQTETVATQRTVTTVQSSREMINQLLDILDQVGFELELPDDSGSEEKVISQPAITNETIDTSQNTSQIYQTQARFEPSKNPYEIVVAGTPYEVTVRPTTIRPNLNVIKRKPLIRYLQYLGLSKHASERLAAVVIDWRDSDSAETHLGADDLFYRSQFPAYTPRNAAIRSWGEITYLKGANPGLIAFLRENFVLHGQDTRLNPDFVEPEVIAVLADLDLEVVEAAINHVRQPNAARADVTLGDIIGSFEANAFNSTVDWSYAKDDLVLIDVAGGRAVVHIAFSRGDDKLLDVYHD